MCLAVVSALSRAAGDAPGPDLEVTSSAVSTRIGERVLVMVTRHPAVSHSPVTVLAPAPAAVTLADSGGTCRSAGAGVHRLIVPADQPNPFVVCLWATTPVKTRVLVSAPGSDEVSRGGQSEIIEVAETSIGTNPVFMALLSAIVGFVLGLGSTWYSAFTDAWRNKQKARAETQEFIAETFFPEIRDHARKIYAYLQAKPDQRKLLAGRPLAEAAATEAHSKERLSKLAEYFDSMRKPALRKRLSKYDELINYFNHEAHRLNRMELTARDTAKQAAIAAALHKLHKVMGFIDNQSSE
jgi:hypothetical protein